MRTVDLILKKRRGEHHSYEELEHLLLGYVKGDIPDYQIAAWLMAVYFQGMDERETADLTKVMLQSGDVIDLSAIEGIKVDKHSTGGVGDKTTLALAPLVAAAGVPVAKMSGRGLGRTGGTLDKLEAIPGFMTELTRDAFVRQVNRIGVAVVGQTGNLTPADKMIYALRDVTGTVDSLPLVASSVMSKKLATGANAIVLDVKTGNGAFMKTEQDALKLAEIMVMIGKRLKRQTVAIVSDMNQPLGFAVGNALEVKEAIATLEGKGPADLTELTLELGSHMLKLARKAATLSEAKMKLKSLMSSGAGLAKLAELIDAQGGDSSIITNRNKLPQARFQQSVYLEIDGFVQKIDAEKIGLSAMILGAGRATKDDVLDLSVGVILHKKIGDHVEPNTPVATVHYNDEQRGATAIQLIKQSFQLTEDENEVNRPSLIYHFLQ